jgi:hypothetical protein
MPDAQLSTLNRLQQCLQTRYLIESVVRQSFCDHHEPLS